MHAQDIVNSSKCITKLHIELFLEHDIEIFSKKSILAVLDSNLNSNLLSNVSSRILGCMY